MERVLGTDGRFPRVALAKNGRTARGTLEAIIPEAPADE